MKKRIRLTEQDIHNIVKESVKNVIQEDFSQDNQIINKIGEQIEPINKMFAEMNYMYGSYLESCLRQGGNGFGFMGKFAKAFKDVVDGLSTMEMIYNH